ncbi:MAG: PEP-CTERM sorting domain-containing protein [Acidobacteriaceae bacterium]|nr:PEP-CTERM sorting domain-containing protein [Acidobacteriaceae bacterium]
MKPAVAALLAVGLSSAAAYADSITFTLTNPNGTVPYNTGGSLTYDATVSAPAGNGAPVFLNGDSFNVTAPVTLNDSDFFSNFPLSLAPGASFTGGLFVLTVPPNSPLGTFLGTFTLLGGATNTGTSTLGTVNFSLTTVTPEPSSILLLLTGMAALGMALLRPRLHEKAP